MRKPKSPHYYIQKARKSYQSKIYHKASQKSGLNTHRPRNDSHSTIRIPKEHLFSDSSKLSSPRSLIRSPSKPSAASPIQTEEISDFFPNWLKQRDDFQAAYRKMIAESEMDVYVACRRPAN